MSVLDINDLDAILEATIPKRDSREGNDSRSGSHVKQHVQKSHFSSHDDKEDSSSRHRYRHGSPEKRRSNSRDRRRHDMKRHRHHQSPSSSRRGRSPSPRRHVSPARPRTPSPELSEAERDRRTVFVQQLAARLRPRELEEFFLQVGKVRQVKIVSDRISGRSKGFGYVEFREETSVPLAILLSGQKVLGIPILVSYTESEKNRLAEEAVSKSRPIVQAAPSPKFRRLVVSSIDVDIEESKLRPIFEAYGTLDYFSLLRDSYGKSKGMALVYFRDHVPARKALEQLDGLELLGKPIVVSVATEADTTAREDVEPQNHTSVQARTELMLKLSRSTDDLIDGKMGTGSATVHLANLYDPGVETDSEWMRDLEGDIRDECAKFGTLLSVSILGTPDGEAVLQYEDSGSAQQAVSVLRGRWFGGRQIHASIQ